MRVFDKLFSADAGPRNIWEDDGYDDEVAADSRGDEAEASKLTQTQLQFYHAGPKGFHLADPSCGHQQ